MSHDPQVTPMPPVLVVQVLGVVGVVLDSGQVSPDSAALRYGSAAPGGKVGTKWKTCMFLFFYV